MAQNITDINDYIGYTKLASSPLPDDTTFADTIFDIEREILRGKECGDYGLLGDQVYLDLLADLDSNNNPQSQKYIDLVNGKNYIRSGQTFIFSGIKKMLTLFCYSEFIKDKAYQETNAGTVQAEIQNSIIAERKELDHRAHQRWNRGVSMYNGEVYDYILNYQSNFTNWSFTQQYKYLTKGIS